MTRNSIRSESRFNLHTFNVIVNSGQFMFFHFEEWGTPLEVLMLSGAFQCLSKHQPAPLSTTVSILENMPKKWPLCRSDVMFSLLYVSIGAKRADFGAIGRFVNLLMWLVLSELDHQLYRVNGVFFFPAPDLMSSLKCLLDCLQECVGISIND